MDMQCIYGQSLLSSLIALYIQLYCRQEKSSQAIEPPVEVRVYCYMFQPIVTVVLPRFAAQLGLDEKCIATRISAAVISLLTSGTPTSYSCQM